MDSFVIKARLPGIARGDDGDAQGHRFQKGDAHPLLARGQGRTGRTRGAFPRGSAEAPGIPTDPLAGRASRSGLRARPLRPLADQGQAGLRDARPEDDRPGVHQGVEPLLGREPTDESGPERIVKSPRGRQGARSGSGRRWGGRGSRVGSYPPSTSSPRTPGEIATKASAARHRRPIAGRTDPTLARRGRRSPRPLPAGGRPGTPDVLAPWPTTT